MGVCMCVCDREGERERASAAACDNDTAVVFLRLHGGGLLKKDRLADEDFRASGKRRTHVGAAGRDTSYICNAICCKVHYLDSRLLHAGEMRQTQQTQKSSYSRM